MAGKIAVISAIAAGLAALAIWTGEAAILALVGAILLLFAAGLAMNIGAAGKIEVSIEAAEGNEEQDFLAVRIRLKNRSVFPAFKGRVRIVAENLNFRFSEKETLAFSIPGKGESELRFQIRSEYCGKYRILVKDVRCIDIWGITSIQAARDLEESACLFPKWTNIGSVSEALRANYEKEKKFAGKKGHILSDVLQYRGYRKGDSLKHVNWKLTAKCGEWIVREFDTPVDNQILIIPDIVPQDPFYQNLAYITFFSVCMSYLNNNISYQIGYVENGKGVVTEIESMEDLFQTMRDILSGSSDGTESALTTISATENLYKYARILYITNDPGEENGGNSYLLGNLHSICVDQKNFGAADYKNDLKKLAV